MDRLSRILKLHQEGYSNSQIARKVNRPMSSIYYALNHRPTQTQSKYKDIGDDFKCYEWQILLAIAGKSRVSRANETYRITLTSHLEELEYFLWKLRLINSLNIAGACKFAKWYFKHNNQLQAELYSSKIGSILSVLKQERKLPIFHLTARTIVYMDGEGSFDYNMTRHLAEIQEIEAGDPIIRGQAKCWEVDRR